MFQTRNHLARLVNIAPSVLDLHSGVCLCALTLTLAQHKHLHYGRC